MCFKHFLVLKRPVPLGIGHRSTVKPAVNNLRHSFHCATTFWAFVGDRVDIRSVEFNIFRRFRRFLPELFYRFNCLLVAARITNPDWKRCSPIPFTAYCPVLDFPEPFAKPALLDVLGIPVNLRVVFKEFVAELAHLDIP